MHVGSHLWNDNRYPHTHGTPALYQTDVTVSVVDCDNASAETGTNSDALTFNFGVRKIDPLVNDTLGGLQFSINGERVFLQVCVCIACVVL